MASKSKKDSKNKKEELKKSELNENNQDYGKEKNIAKLEKDDLNIFAESELQGELKKTKKQENKLEEAKDKKEEISQEKETLDKEIDVDEAINNIDSKIEELSQIEDFEKEKIEKDSDKKELKPKKQEKILKQQDLLERSIQNKRKLTYIAISVLIILIVALFFSTIFAILNVGNETFIKGVKLKNIDISGLTIKDAKEKMNEALKIELMQNITLTYKKNSEITLDPNQIEFSYNLEEAINEAYKIGRSSNIVGNNYELLFTAFLGKNINIDYTYNEELLNTFINDLESKIPGTVVEPTYYIEDNQLIINNGIDGIVIDKNKLKQNIVNKILERNAETLISNTENECLEIPVIEKKAEEIDIEKIYSEIYTEPKDAYFELEPFKIYPEVNGIDLQIGLEEAKKQILAEEKEEYRFLLNITPAQKTIKDLGTEAFPYLISSFTTKYDASNVNRSKNLAIAAEKINGVVLMPEETFSFNKVVGKRTVEEGYKDAKIYVDGGVTEGLAGGICQISSTLYNAVLLANLDIVERKNHSFTTSYVPAGRDATVVYGTIDFQFKNSRNYPIKIEASVSGGIAEFKIYGIAEETEYEVKIIPKTTQSIPYTTEYIQDATLAPGQQIIVQAGHSGYKVTTYKELRQNGKVVSRELLSNDTYKAMKAIIRKAP